MTVEFCDKTVCQGLLGALGVWVYGHVPPRQGFYSLGYFPGAETDFARRTPALTSSPLPLPAPVASLSTRVPAAGLQATRPTSLAAAKAPVFTPQGQILPRMPPTQSFFPPMVSGLPLALCFALALEETIMVVKEVAGVTVVTPKPNGTWEKERLPMPGSPHTPPAQVVYATSQKTTVAIVAQAIFDPSQGKIVETDLVYCPFCGTRFDWTEIRVLGAWIRPSRRQLKQQAQASQQQLQLQQQARKQALASAELMSSKVARASRGGAEHGFQKKAVGSSKPDRSS